VVSTLPLHSGHPGFHFWQPILTKDFYGFPPSLRAKCWDNTPKEDMTASSKILLNFSLTFILPLDAMQLTQLKNIIKQITKQ
jgi:hypothetical protein